MRDPTKEERYVPCVPLIPLKAAAGAFRGVASRNV